MDPIVVMQLGIMGAPIAAVIAIMVGQQRQRDRARKRLELAPGPDWGLRSWRPPTTEDYFFTFPGGRPEMGKLDWVHHTWRDGRDLMVCREVVSSGRNSSEFYVVATQIRDRDAAFFSNGGHVEGNLPPHLAAQLHGVPGAAWLRATLLGGGFLVLRVRGVAALDEGIDMVTRVAGQLDAEWAKRAAPAPAWGRQWEQPPTGVPRNRVG